MFRKAFTVGVVSACLVLPALAQTPKRGEAQREQQQQAKRELRSQRAQVKQRLQARAKSRADADVRKFARGLNLSEAQSEQLKALMSARDMERQRLRTESAKGRKGDARALREKFRSDFRSILTPEQAETLDQRARGRKK
jgi:hypothetical protein